MNLHTLRILIECATSHIPGDNILSAIWYSPTSVDTRHWLRAEGLIDGGNRATPRGHKWLNRILAVSVPSDEAEVGDGGPAFPYRWDDGHEDMGMAVRDWFAGQAFPALIAVTRSGPYQSQEHMRTEIAREAYAVADAMLAAREAQS